jgi:hypothetical protein
MSAAPRIDNGKHFLEPLNIMTVGWLPSDTPYGNLLLKGMDIVRRIDRVNLEVERVFATYVHPSKLDINDPRQDILEHQFYQEEVVYWLRKTADELISLAYVIDEWKRTRSWPRAVQVDSIAGLSGITSREIQELFAPHASLLSTLNEVANAFKHSFINTDMAVVGAEYPVVFALALRRNKLSEQPVFYSVSFQQMIEAFSSFYNHVFEVIREWAGIGRTEHRPND